MTHFSDRGGGQLHDDENNVLRVPHHVHIFEYHAVESGETFNLGDMRDVGSGRLFGSGNSGQGILCMSVGVILK